MAAGAVGVCLSVGGDVRVRGTAPGGTPWTVAVEHPLAAAPVTLVGLWDGAVATSSVLRRVWQAGGRPRHHIIDPDTGVPSHTTADLASVIAGDGWLAEVLTKPVLLRPADRRFDNVPDGCAALAVAADGTVAVTPSIGDFTGGALVPTVLRSVERTHPGGAR
ncbi:MAG: FAD:protein FMN transferase [Ilumatobacteraceae bacterium]